jgi:hypothetical protein
MNGLDLIEELRLRRWARENYVPSDQRTGDLHPVVLEEMQQRDAEREAGLPRMHRQRAKQGQSLSASA